MELTGEITLGITRAKLFFEIKFLSLHVLGDLLCYHSFKVRGCGTTIERTVDDPISIQR